MRGAERKRDRKRASPPYRAPRLDRSTMELDEFGHKRKADTGALLASSARALNPVEALENMWQFMIRNACSGILDRERGMFTPRTRVTVTLPSKVYLRALESRLKTTFSHISRST